LARGTTYDHSLGRFVSKCPYHWHFNDRAAARTPKETFDCSQRNVQEAGIFTGAARARPWAVVDFNANHET
jgi:hypothetical protein